MLILGIDHVYAKKFDEQNFNKSVEIVHAYDTVFSVKFQ